MANHKWRSSPAAGGIETAVWAAKLALSFLAVISFGAVARAAVPAAAEVLASALPGYWLSLGRSWIAPPYLFLAVHFIILVIWKLSDTKQQQQQEGWPAMEERTMERGNPMGVEILEPSPAARPLRNPSQEIRRNETPKSPAAEAVPAPERRESFPRDEPLATQPAGEGLSPAAVMMEKSVVPEPKSSVAAAVSEEEGEESRAPAAERMEDASLKATWEAVAKESSSSSSSSPAETALQSRSYDEELNRRFEDFIKRNHEQIRLPGNRRRQFVLENATASSR